MGLLSIPSAWKQMDGIFGCKVLADVDQNGFSNFTINKKTIIDFFIEIFSGKMEKSLQKNCALAALQEIKKKIGDIDSGSFSALVKTYEDNDCPIDFVNVRRTLRESLKLRTLPMVYAKTAPKNIETLGSDAMTVEGFKNIYLENIKKSVCRESEVRIFRDSEAGVVTDANYEGFAQAFIAFKENSEEDFYVNEDNLFIKAKIDQAVVAAQIKNLTKAVS